MRTLWVILVLLSEFIFYTEQIAAVCDLPKEQGLCKAYLRRYYFDKNSNQCVEFTYGGCGGNKNNFEKLDDCEETCMLPAGQSLETDKNNDVCSLPKVEGPCRARLDRFYFNKQTSQCEDFQYGGCHGNDNNFLTLEECQNQCGSLDQGGLDDVCNLPKDVGPCKAANRRYFYNSQNQKCEQFIFGGCRGNENNFMSLDECKIKCQSQDQILPTEDDVCNLPKDVGPCKASKRRYFYNSQNHKCEQFNFGGCRGNENNFMSLDECKIKCQSQDQILPTAGNICKLPKVIGPCDAIIPRHFYNSQSQQCESFNYGGCQGNDNNFDDVTECKRKCEVQDQTSNYKDICKLPKKKGPCKAILHRYYYNTNTQKCEKFIYGGCQGNENNFEDIFICSRTCENQDQTSDDICSLPQKSGPCYASFKRYYFNSKTHTCEEFIWGGCQPNENNFESLDKCREACNPEESETDICSLPQKSGPCYGSFKRYYFNSKTHTCEEFIWGGCQPNENNFESLDKCREACSPEESETDIEQSHEETDY